MNFRHFSFFRRAVASLLMLLSLNVVSAFGQSVPGQIGNALSFGGQYEANMPHIGSFNANDITIEAWVRMDQLTGQQQTVITDPGTSSFNILADGSVAFRVIGQYTYPYTSSGPFGKTSYINAKHSHTITSNPGLIVPGQWHHIAGVYKLSSGEITVLVDNTHKTETVRGAQRVMWGTQTYKLKKLVDSNHPLRIGLNLVGQIDELRFWSSARSINDIQANRGFALNGNEAGLAGLWHMDGSGLSDTTPPVLVLNGEAEITLDQPYVELGATATEPSLNLVVADAGPYANNGNYYIGETSLPVTISGSVGTALGDYTVTYTATDVAGNTATADRIVHVVPAFYEVGGALLDIAIGPEGSVFGLALDKTVRKWDGTAWQAFGNNWGFEQITVDSNGLPWVLANNNIVYRWDPAQSTWVNFDYSHNTISGTSFDIVYGARSLFGIAQDNTVRQWDGASWNHFNQNGVPEAARMAVKPTGEPWFLAQDGSIWAWSGAAFGTWSDGRLLDIAFRTDLNVFGIGLDHTVQHWNGTNWDYLDGENGVLKATRIAVDPSDHIWVVAEDNTVWRWNAN